MASQGAFRKAMRNISPAWPPADIGLRRALSRIGPERTILRQSSLVLVLCATIALFPGIFMGVLDEYLVLVPGLLMLIPPTVGLRGNIFGALGSRLSSKLHIGTLEPQMGGNKVLLRQLFASTVQLMVLSAFIPIVGEVLGLLLPIDMAPFFILLFISLTAGLLSGLVLFAITVWITFASYRKMWDPDNVSAPVIATAGDLLTVPVLFLCAYLALELPSLLVMSTALLLLILMLAATVPLFLGSGSEGRKVLRDSMPVAAVAVLLSTVAGLILGASFESFFAGSIFLVYIPVFNEQGGSMGSILGSRITSAAYLGSIKMTGRPNSFALRSSFSLWLISLVVFSMMSVLSFVLGPISGLPIPPIPVTLLVLLAGATSIAAISSLVAYYIAYVSFRIGLDPDNVVIPLLTATMDIVGSGSLLFFVLAAGHLF